MMVVAKDEFAQSYIAQAVWARFFSTRSIESSYNRLINALIISVKPILKHGNFSSIVLGKIFLIRLWIIPDDEEKRGTW